MVHEIKDGEVILMNGAKREPLTIQKKATVSLIKGENTGVTKAVPEKAIDATMERGRINSGLRSPLPQRPIGRPGTRNAPLRSTNIMTPEERAMIDAFEPGYRHEREALLSQYQSKVSELASLLEQTESHTPVLTESIHALHGVHGKLQALSIKHFYDMLSVLPPEKKDKLRSLAVETLSLPE